MRRLSLGIHWLVTHLESMTQLLAMNDARRPAWSRAAQVQIEKPVFAGHAAIAWRRALHEASASPIGVEAGP
jgi:hypothetical protein